MQRLISSLRLWLWPTCGVTVIRTIGLHVDSIKASPFAGTASLDESTSNAGGIAYQFCQIDNCALLYECYIQDVLNILYNLYYPASDFERYEFRIFIWTVVKRLYRWIDTWEECTFLSLRLFARVILEYLSPCSLYGPFVVWLYFNAFQCTGITGLVFFIIAV
jgi:hypothetical protein